MIVDTVILVVLVIDTVSWSFLTHYSIFVFLRSSLGWRGDGNPLYYYYYYLSFLFFFFAFSRAASVAYGGSQARGPVGAVAAGLHQSHSNAGSELRLQPTPQLTATPDT